MVLRHTIISHTNFGIAGVNRAARDRKGPTDRNMTMISSDVSHLGLGRLLREASQALRTAMRDCLSDQSLTFSEWLHLRVLGDEDGLTAVEIAQRIGIEKASSTSVLDSLERQKFIRRLRNRVDRRKSNTFLTVAGSKYLEQMTPYVEAVHGAALQGVSPREIAIFNKVARAIIDNLEEPVQPPGGKSTIAPARVPARKPRSRAGDVAR
jgi:DNA-binding MarR family transcriptional regulator